MNNYHIYLAGGMSNLSFQEQNGWREKIKKFFEDYECDYRVKCINPVDYYNSFDGTTYDSDLEVMQFDLHKLKNSDLIIMNFNNMSSLGSMAELAIAWDRGIPVIGLNENEPLLHPWQYCMCSKIFNNLGDVLEYIANYYLD